MSPMANRSAPTGPRPWMDWCLYGLIRLLLLLPYPVPMASVTGVRRLFLLLL